MFDAAATSESTAKLTSIRRYWQLRRTNGRWLRQACWWHLSRGCTGVLTDWFNTEARTSKHQAARALMMFRGFLRWCAARPEYRAMVNREAGKAAAIVEAMPQVTKRTDCLEAAQVAGWFEGTKKLVS